MTMVIAAAAAVAGGEAAAAAAAARGPGREGAHQGRGGGRLRGGQADRGHVGVPAGTLRLCILIYEDVSLSFKRKYNRSVVLIELLLFCAIKP